MKAYKIFKKHSSDRHSITTAQVLGKAFSSFLSSVKLNARVFKNNTVCLDPCVSGFLRVGQIKLH